MTNRINRQSAHSDARSSAFDNDNYRKPGGLRQAPPRDGGSSEKLIDSEMCDPKRAVYLATGGEAHIHSDR